MAHLRLAVFLAVLTACTAATCPIRDSDATSLLQLKLTETQWPWGKKRGKQTGPGEARAVKIGPPEGLSVKCTPQGYITTCIAHDGLGGHLHAVARSDQPDTLEVVVVKSQGHCTALFRDAVEKIQEDLEKTFQELTLDFFANPANKGCSCYTHAAFDLGFKKLTLKSKPASVVATYLEVGSGMASKEWYQQFGIDCSALPAGPWDSRPRGAQAWKFSKDSEG